RGKRLRAESLAVSFAGRDIAELAGMPFTALVELLRPIADLTSPLEPSAPLDSGELTEVARTLVRDLLGRIEVLIELGLGYLAMDRTTPTLSAGELQRLRLAGQLRGGLFGVLYVLDEPSAGLHPADAAPLVQVLNRLKESGNSLFVVEHDLDVMRQADWLVDVGPGAGEQGGQVLYSGPPTGLVDIDDSVTGRYLSGELPERLRTEPRKPSEWLTLDGVSRHNLHQVSAAFPLGLFTAVTGVSGSGKSSLVSQVLVAVVAERLGATSDEGPDDDQPEAGEPLDDAGYLDDSIVDTSAIQLSGLDRVTRLVLVDQKPIGRTPRSNLATYTGLFDAVRKAFAQTDEARRRGYGAGRFSFNVPGGRCENCQGAGTVSVELLFLPGSYGPCPVCHGARYNPETLQISYRGRSVAEVLELTVQQAAEFLADLPGAARSLDTLRQVGLGYLRLGQPATELSGGEAQRIKLSRELQRGRRGHTLYVLDEPTTGLHPADVQVLLRQLDGLVAGGDTVIVVEHDLAVVAAADWVIDLGPGGGDQGGTIVATGSPAELAAGSGATAGYLAQHLGHTV
ncbi:MAG TPA: excinuclease ABC subunit A, partial [Jatrophihabitans sp.]|nr:excinuclease ABC subunit A [Jatrophihabitans sp.]